MIVIKSAASRLGCGERFRLVPAAYVLLLAGRRGGVAAAAPQHRFHGRALGRGRGRSRRGGGVGASSGVPGGRRGAGRAHPARRADPDHRHASDTGHRRSARRAGGLLLRLPQLAWRTAADGAGQVRRPALVRPRCAAGPGGAARADGAGGAAGRPGAADRHVRLRCHLATRDRTGGATASVRGTPRRCACRGAGSANGANRSRTPPATAVPSSVRGHLRPLRRGPPRGR